MPHSRTALAQLADRFTGRSRRPERPWTIRAQTPACNPVETALLAVVFSGFAWLLAFDLMAPIAPGWLAGGLAVPGAFLILQLVPVSIGFALDRVARLFRHPTGWNAHWISEEIHLILATAYAAVCGVAGARSFCQVWLVLVALNVVAFILLCAVRSANTGKSPHA